MTQVEKTLEKKRKHLAWLKVYLLRMFSRAYFHDKTAFLEIVLCKAHNRFFFFPLVEDWIIFPNPCSACQHSWPLDLCLFHSGSQVRLMAPAGFTPAVGHHLLANIQDAWGLYGNTFHYEEVCLPAVFMQVSIWEVLVLLLLVWVHTFSDWFNS